MWRRAFQIAAASSFLLCLVVHVLWLRSYVCSESVTWSNTGGWRILQTAQGHLEFCCTLADWSDHPAATLQRPSYERTVIRPPIDYNFFALLCSNAGDWHIDWRRGGFAWYARLNFKPLLVPCLRHHGPAASRSQPAALLAQLHPIIRRTEVWPSQDYNPSTDRLH